MIREREVVKMRVPFPDIDSGLALNEHMYICCSSNFNKKSFVKCQTFKPLFARSDHEPYRYILERRNPDRNPFNKPMTLIDLDKLFSTDKVRFNRGCLTTNRNDVCKDLFISIKEKVSLTDIKNIPVESNILIELNRFCEDCRKRAV